MKIFEQAIERVGAGEQFEGWSPCGDPERKGLGSIISGVAVLDDRAFLSIETYRVPIGSRLRITVELIEKEAGG